jgi:hypothetical protein
MEIKSREFKPRRLRVSNSKIIQLLHNHTQRTNEEYYKTNILYTFVCSFAIWFFYSTHPFATSRLEKHIFLCLSEKKKFSFMFFFTFGKLFFMTKLQKFQSHEKTINKCLKGSLKTDNSVLRLNEKKSRTYSPIYVEERKMNTSRVNVNIRGKERKFQFIDGIWCWGFCRQISVSHSPSSSPLYVYSWWKEESWLL